MGGDLRQGRLKRQLWSCFHCQKSWGSRFHQEVALAKHIREAEILNNLSNDHIVRMKGFWANPLAIMLEYLYFDLYFDLGKFLYQMSSVQAKYFTIDGF